MKRTNPGNWPRDSGSIQKRIAVDFNMNLNELAVQPVDRFQAIRPIHPNAFFDREFLRRPVESLLQTIRRLPKENNKAAGESQKEDAQ
ncbi:MAG: hypothetical protein ACP5XB_15640 [Isosphaeraceae bacterium]